MDHPWNIPHLVIRDIAVSEIDALADVLDRMSAIVSEAMPERSFAGIVDELSDEAIVTWRSGDSTVRVRSDVMDFAGSTSMDALRIELRTDGRRYEIEEAQRRIRLSGLTTSHAPSAIMRGILRDHVECLAHAPRNAEEWIRPAMQSDVMTTRLLAGIMASSIPRHALATGALWDRGSRPECEIARIVMPSPYRTGYYQGIVGNESASRSMREAMRRTSPLLPECVEVAGIPRSAGMDRGWRMGPYRTGFERLDMTGDPIETFRVLRTLD